MSKDLELERKAVVDFHAKLRDYCKSRPRCLDCAGDYDCPLGEYCFQTNPENFDGLVETAFDELVDVMGWESAALQEQTSVESPTEESKAAYEHNHGETLHGWCQKCARPISGELSSLWNYCPWCGRRISKPLGCDYIDYTK